MSSAARIEELQKKFDENPRRYFAPLANECRKAGDLDAAIAICRTHLPQQPGHMSGHIVYGQALFESGDLVEAQTVFETALGLDPENLIALRHMGDIAARHGDLAGARQWYDRVLETDPRNEEIQALVAGLGGAPIADAPRADAPVADASVADASLGDAPAAEVSFDEQALDEAPRVRGGLPSLVDPELLAVAAEAVPDDAAEELSIPPGATSDEPMEGSGFDSPAAPAIGSDSDLLDFGDPEPAPGLLVTTESDAATGANMPREELLEPTAMEFEAPTGTGTMEGLEATTFEAPSPDEALTYERVGDEALLDGLDARAPQLDGLETAEFDASGYGGSGLETIAGPSFDFEPADHAEPAQVEASQAPEAFVTETMAELYLRQGYRDEALVVYRQLVGQSPDDRELRSRMEQLEGEIAAGATVDRADAPRLVDAEVDDVIAGLPRAIDPELVAVAAEAAPDDVDAAFAAGGKDATTAAGRAGLTIRDYLAALATGRALGADDEIDALPAPTDGGEIAEVVDLGAFDLAEPEAPLPEPVSVDGVAGIRESVPDSGAGFAATGDLDAMFAAPQDADLRAADVLAAAYGQDAGKGSAQPNAIVPTALPGGAMPEPSGEAAVPESAGAADAGPAPETTEQAADPLRGRPARPAGTDLSLDHVFGAPRHQGSPRNTGGFSFDQFFAEGSAKPARDETPEPSATTGDEEDLEQFNSWLHNLRKQ